MPNPWATCGHAPIAQQQGNSRTPSLNAAQGNSSSLSVAQLSQKVGHAALWDVVEKDQRWGKGRDQSGLVRNQYGNQKACTLLWLCPAPHQCVPGEVGAGSSKPEESDNQKTFQETPPARADCSPRELSGAKGQPFRGTAPVSARCLLAASLGSAPSSAVPRLPRQRRHRRRGERGPGGRMVRGAGRGARAGRALLPSSLPLRVGRPRFGAPL